jgi:hypothetical protein
MDSVDAVYFTNYTGYLWKLLGPVRNYIVTALGLLAAPVLFCRQKIYRAFSLWGLLLGVQALPWGVQLAPFRPDHMVIVLFLPVGILSAGLLIFCLDFLKRRFPAPGIRVLAGAGFAACCLFGIWDTRTVVNPATVFADAYDREAIEWAAQNTPPDALFLINTAYWQVGLYRGVDGGWWLLPLAERSTQIPPALYSFLSREEVERINREAGRVSGFTGCTSEFKSFVEEKGITHIYARNDAGSLRSDALRSCAGLDEVYRNDKVSIFKITPGR